VYVDAKYWGTGAEGKKFRRTEGRRHEILIVNPGCQPIMGFFTEGE
jgi:hypothetical protein